MTTTESRSRRRRRVRGFIVVLMAWLASTTVLFAQQKKRLTLDDIYDPATKVSFSGAPLPAITWIDATHYARLIETSAGTEWAKIDAATGEQSRLFDPAAMEAAAGRLAGIAAQEAKRVARGRTLVFNKSYTAAALHLGDDLYAYTFADSRIVRLTSGSGGEEQVSFSPDGRLVGFVRRNNLYVAGADGGGERALTTDGGPKVLNGRLDWVYEEEVYGRGQSQAYWWSPDSTRIAFLRLDDRQVPTFPVVDHLSYDQDVEQLDYPKAGDPNPIVTLGVSSLTGATAAWIDTSGYADVDRLIVRVGWTPDSRKIAFVVQNRTQSWLDLNEADPETGKTQLVLKETSKFWIGSDDVSLPVWLENGTFLWLSDRSGWRHLYHYAGNGTLIAQVTRGSWEVRTLHGVDEAKGWIYFSGTERSPIGIDTYRVKMDGSELHRLSTAEGTHSTQYGPSLLYYVDTWSNVMTPPQMRLHKADGSSVRVIADNEVAALKDYELSQPEFLRVKARDGFVMEAMMIKPPHFDPARKYPVYQFTYGGPHTQQVVNQWGGSQFMFHQLLAQKGIVVWICDNRTASGKGIESEWPLFRRMGESELRDIEDGVSWLTKQPYVDASRIGIHGWSYGGFMTSYALTHSKSFVMGIAGGTVADWRDYDSIYTERYLGLPDENADGYRKSSPRFAAADLHGALLLIHGTIDDNVHLSNTMQFAYELQRSQKPFRLMLYPKSRHGVTDPPLVKHLRATMLDFVLEELRPDGAERTTSPGR